MAKRQIVIELSDRLIKKVKDHYVNPYEVDEIGEAILNGTPIPKGHGRLISEEDVLAAILSSKLFDDANCEEVKEMLSKIPTILEADGEMVESEDKE